MLQNKVKRPVIQFDIRMSDRYQQCRRAGSVMFAVNDNRLEKLIVLKLIPELLSACFDRQRCVASVLFECLQQQWFCSNRLNVQPLSEAAGAGPRADRCDRGGVPEAGLKGRGAPALRDSRGSAPWRECDWRGALGRGSRAPKPSGSWRPARPGRPMASGRQWSTRSRLGSSGR